MAQFVQLQQNLQAFHAEGIAVVGMTYDTPAQQQPFLEKNGIEFPFLSDIDAHSVKALHILNITYQPGDDSYGIPYPGIFIVSPDKKIVGKIFVDGYQKRLDAAAVLTIAKELLQ
ncbi:MAG: peroxiredoxin [Halioglobus sp.]|jgi:peroxiredoxin